MVTNVLVMPTTVIQINRITLDLIKTQIKINSPTPVSAEKIRDLPEVCLDRKQVERVPLEALALVEVRALEDPPPVGDMVTRDCLEGTSS